MSPLHRRGDDPGPPPALPAPFAELDRYLRARRRELRRRLRTAAPEEAVRLRALEADLADTLGAHPLNEDLVRLLRRVIRTLDGASACSSGPWTGRGTGVGVRPE
jgi:hypothetical protein